MADQGLRRLERAAAAGDPEADRRLFYKRCRAEICPFCVRQSCVCPKPVLCVSNLSIAVGLIGEVPSFFTLFTHIKTEVDEIDPFEVCLVLPRAGMYSVMYKGILRRKPRLGPLLVWSVLLLEDEFVHCTNVVHVLKSLVDLPFSVFFTIQASSTSHLILRIGVDREDGR